MANASPRTERDYLKEQFKSKCRGYDINGAMQLVEANNSLLDEEMLIWMRSNDEYIEILQKSMNHIFNNGDITILKKFIDDKNTNIDNKNIWESKINLHHDLIDLRDAISNYINYTDKRKSDKDIMLLINKCKESITEYNKHNIDKNQDFVKENFLEIRNMLTDPAYNANDSNKKRMNFIINNVVPILENSLFVTDDYIKKFIDKSKNKELIKTIFETKEELNELKVRIDLIKSINETAEQLKKLNLNIRIDKFNINRLFITSKQKKGYNDDKNALSEAILLNTKLEQKLEDELKTKIDELKTKINKIDKTKNKLTNEYKEALNTRNNEYKNKSDELEEKLKPLEKILHKYQIYTRLFIQDAIQRNDLNYLKELFKIDNNAELYLNINSDGKTALYSALITKNIDYEIIKFLIDRTQDINVLNKYDKVFSETVLHAAVKNFYQTSDSTSKNKYYKIIENLLEKSPDLVIKDHNSNTAFEVALNNTPECDIFDNSKDRITYGKTIMNLFLEKHPDLINIKDNDGDTALHNALNNYKNNSDVIKFLLEKNPKLDIQNNHGDTALHVALRNRVDPDIIKLLLKKNPNLDIKNNDDKTPLDIARENKTYYETIKDMLPNNKNTKNKVYCGFLSSW